MNRTKFIIGGGIILAAIIYLIFSSTQATAQYFLTVDEVLANPQIYQGRELRLSGAVIGDTIKYDPQALTLSFQIAHVPGDNQQIERLGGLARVLHDAAADPNRQRVTVTYKGPKPDLLRNEAQAILTGNLAEDGSFTAQEVLLKCPSKYEEALPQQSKGLR